jgi:hypothetical protein
VIYITHGVVPYWSSGRISHALLLPESQFTQHLRERRTKYVSISEALAGKGDALTVDDATYGSLKMALLARQYGHAVAWFVNGSNVEQGKQYFPYQLSWMLDESMGTECRFEGERWDMQVMAYRRALRFQIKAAYMRLQSQREIDQLVDKLAYCLSVDPAKMQRSLTTVSSADLTRAVAAGVDLQNHSWTHINPRLFSERERTAEVLRNEEFLSRYRESAVSVFAPPFGYHASISSAPGHIVLLANRKLGSSYRDGNVVNRRDLHLTDSAPEVPQVWPVMAEAAEQYASR